MQLADTFKASQEADLQRYRTQLISMGKIENAAGANLKPRRHKSFEESIKAFEVYCLFCCVHLALSAQLTCTESYCTVTGPARGLAAASEIR